VRREKGAGLQWGELKTKPTRQISLQPVAIGAGEEATRRPKPSMEKAPLKGVSERAGRNANEHRAGPEIM
jgi:hypothetical protein